MAGPIKGKMGRPSANPQSKAVAPKATANQQFTFVPPMLGPKSKETNMGSPNPTRTPTVKPRIKTGR